MKRFVARLATVGLTVLAVVAFFAPRTVAQDAPPTAKPIAVVSIASVEEVLGDIGYLTESAGQGDFGKMVALLSGGYTVGVDKKRPLGMIVTIKNDEPNALLFVPVKNLDAVLAGIEQQVGKPQDAGDGVLELGGARGNPIYVKEANGWAFVAQKANDLTDLAQIDPAAALGDLTKGYTVAVSINVSNIPAEAKKVAVAQLKAQVERQLAEQLEQQPEAQRAITERYTRTMLQQVTSLVEDTDRITLGLQVDSQAKTTHLDAELVARADTKLAQQMALLANIKPLQAGYLAPEAAVNLHIATRISEEDIALYNEVIATARENALQEIEKDGDIETEEARRIAKEAIGALFDVGQATIAAGKVEGGAALFLSPEGQLNFVAGGTVKDAARLEETFKKMVEATKNEPKAPKVAFDADRHGDVRFHTLSLAIEARENDARKLFGERLDVAVGFGEESVHVAIGPAGLATAKKILDDSQAKRSVSTPPSQFVVALGPILKFASAVREDPVTAVLAGAIDQNKGQDHISIKAHAIERGVRYRLEVEQGVLQLIGAAAKLMGNQRRQPDLF